jgi:hypothetical protein
MDTPEEHPISACMQELAAFFEQQQQNAEEALRQNYALHEVHLKLLEEALGHVQADKPEEAEVMLLRFYTEEQPRFSDQARLQARLGREERSPHQERHEELLRQLFEAVQQQNHLSDKERRS